MGVELKSCFDRIASNVLFAELKLKKPVQCLAESHLPVVLYKPVGAKNFQVLTTLCPETTCDLECPFKMGMFNWDEA